MRRRSELPLDELELDLIVAVADESASSSVACSTARCSRCRRAGGGGGAENLARSRVRGDRRIQGTSVNTALSRYQYGLSKLRKELAAHG